MSFENLRDLLQLAVVLVILGAGILGIVEFAEQVRGVYTVHVSD